MIFISEGWLLALLCGSTLLLFGDRGVLACNSVNGKPAMDGHPGYGIQGEFGLDLLQDGVLAACMMVGLMISAPISAQMSPRIAPLRLLALGLCVWVLGTLGCSLAPTFPALLLCRLAIGAACGPFIALAAPVVDDMAPADKKSLWLALLFLCMPSGFACGYIFGGIVGTALGWRAAFAAESAAMVPLALLIHLAPPRTLRSGKPAAAAAGAVDAAALPASGPAVPARSSSGSGGGGSGASKALAALAADVRQLNSSRTCVLTILALSMYNGTLGCYSFYGPKAARDIFELHPEQADLLFGAITVATGVLGTLCGGLLLDAVGSSVRNALMLCAVGLTAGTALVLVGFASVKTLPVFAPVFAAGEFGMFLMAAPVNVALMGSVPPELRPFALSASEFMQHLIGDIPCPPALGWLQLQVNNWRQAMCAATALMVVASLLFWLMLCLEQKSPSYREVLEVEGGRLVGQEEERERQEGGQAEGTAAAALAAAGEAAAGHGIEAAVGDDLEQPLLQG